MGQIVPALDLRPANEAHPNAPDVEFASIPSNIEAEQALLGTLLYDNEALDLIEVDLQPDHFFEPLHHRLFRSIESAIRGGLRADPTTLAEEFRRSPAFNELGGVRYLADLIDRAPPSVNAPDYARVIYEEANRRALIRVGETMVGCAKGGMVGEDGERLAPAAIIEFAEADLLRIQVTGRGRNDGELISMSDATRAVLDYIDDRSTVVGSRFGLPPVDLQLGPMMAGDLILLAGRPSMGKSAVALSASINVAAPHLADMLNGVDYDGRAPRGVIEFHGEMAVNRKEGGQVARRHLSNIGFGLYGRSSPTYRNLRDKQVSADQREMLYRAASNFDGVPLKSIKRTGLKLSTLRSIARRQIAAWKREGIEPGLVVIDHVGLFRPEGRTSGRYEAQTEIAIGTKELADELGVPVIALVQLSRGIEQRDDKRPQLSDLRDSGAWEENADIAAFVYRDAYYAAREPEPDQIRDQLAWAEWDVRKRSKEIDVIFGKVREGEAGGTAKVWGELAWNAVRGSEPMDQGGMF